MNAQILIKTANDWFEFSKSKTGQLDFVGKWENKNKPDVNGAQKLASSTFSSLKKQDFLEDAVSHGRDFLLSMLLYRKI